MDCWRSVTAPATTCAELLKLAITLEFVHAAMLQSVPKRKHGTLNE